MWTCCIVLELAYIIGTLSHGIIIKENAEIQNFRRDFKVLLQRIYDELPYQTILLQQRQLTDCVDEQLQQLLTVPVLSWSTTVDTLYWKASYNSDILVIMCLTSISDQKSLQQLASNLQHMRDTRILAIVSIDYNNNNTQWQLQQFFSMCMKLQLLSISLFHRNYHHLGIYHSYTQFPIYQLEQRSLHTQEHIFPNRLWIMQGKALLTVLDQIMPRAVLYTDASGRRRAVGYMVKFMRAFAQKYNCTLHMGFNLNVDDVIYINEVRAATRNGSIDIATSLSTTQRDLNIHEYSYPTEITKLLTMIPIEQPVPTNRLLLTVVDVHFQLLMALLCLIFSLLLAAFKAQAAGSIRQIALAELCCHHAAIRGMLGQAFHMQRQLRYSNKFVYMLICFTGLVFVTSYAGNLTNLLTTRPLQAPIRSFDDALRRNLKVLVSEDELNNFIFYTGHAFWQKYKSIFAMVKTYDDLTIMRKSLNTRYAYPVSTSIWSLFEEQQKHFSRRLFRLSTELSYRNFTLLSLFIHENSIYRRPLNRLVMQTQDSGLYASWTASVFYEFLLAGKISFKDPGTISSSQSLRVQDFDWIWLAFSIAVLLCLLVFVTEIIYFRYRAKTNINLRTSTDNCI